MIKYKGYLFIAHAIVHAMMILVASFILRETGHHQTVTYLIVSLWFATGVMLTYPDRVVCEMRWISKRLFPWRRKGLHDNVD